MALQIRNRFYNRLRRGKETSAPACHAIRFGKRPDQNRAVLEFGDKLHDVVMRSRGVNQLFVTFVKDAYQVVFQNQFSDAGERRRRINDAGRIVGRIEDNAASAGGDDTGEFVGVNLKTSVGSGQRNRGCSSQSDLLRQRDPIR